jgi:hypothetical protein
MGLKDNGVEIVPLTSCTGHLSCDQIGVSFEQALSLSTHNSDDSIQVIRFGHACLR